MDKEKGREREHREHVPLPRGLPQSHDHGGRLVFLGPPASAAAHGCPPFFAGLDHLARSRPRPRYRAVPPLGTPQHNFLKAPSARSDEPALGASRLVLHPHLPSPPWTPWSPPLRIPIPASRGQVPSTRPAPHPRLSPQPLPPSPQMCASGCCPRRRNLRRPSRRQPRSVSSRWRFVTPSPGVQSSYTDAMVSASIPVATTCRPPLSILAGRPAIRIAGRGNE